MWIYYQTQENSKQKWILAADSAEKELREGEAFHMSIYKLDQPAEAEVDAHDIKYKGDFWIDIDQPNLELAIDDFTGLLRYLREIGIEVPNLKLYASGGKGFHICIPGALMGATQALKDLPRIHRLMAEELINESNADGIDLQLYACGKGKLLRVENKQRSNGRYKVRLKPEEIWDLDTDKYVHITSEPRVDYDPPVTKAAICKKLTVMFVDAHNLVKEMNRMPFNPVTEEMLKAFTDNNPRCVDWLTNAKFISPKADKFNRAKMSLTRYLNSCTAGDDIKQGLISNFADHWESDTNKTKAQREQAVKYSLRSGSSYAFDCGYMTRMFSQSPCDGCPIKEQKREKAIARSGLIAYPEGYARNDGKDTMITNFLLKPVRMYTEEDDHTFEGYDFTYQVAGRGDRPLYLNFKAFSSIAEFKRQIGAHLGIMFKGTDNDLQELKQVLTDPTVTEGIQMVRTVKTLGIYHYVDSMRGIDELVWVEPNKSLAACGLADTVKYMGVRRDNNGVQDNITMKMSEIPDLTTLNGEQLEWFNQALRWMFDVNEPEVMAPVLGWLSACWLKVYLTKATDRHFPCLQIFGLSGIGKTEMTSLLSLIAGANYLNAAPMAISQSTPFALVEEGRLTTSIPRILDEFNKTKIADQKRYQVAREVVKAAASGENLSQGKLKVSGQVEMDVRQITSPFIMLATTENAEKEVEERTVIVNLREELKSKGTHRDSFELLKENVEYLFPLPKLLMNEVMINTTQEWVKGAFKTNKEAAKINDRKGKNWHVVLTGLDFFIKSLQRYNGKIDQDNLDSAISLKEYLLGRLSKGSSLLMSNVLANPKATEVEIVLSKLGTLAMMPEGQGIIPMKEGTHYAVEGKTLHLFVSPAYMLYRRLIKEEGATLEYDTAEQFKTALKARSYFLGVGLAADKKPKMDWFALNLPGMEEHGVEIEMFTGE